MSADFTKQLKDLQEARAYYASRDKYWDTCILVLDDAIDALLKAQAALTTNTQGLT